VTRRIAVGLVAVAAFCVVALAWGEREHARVSRLALGTRPRRTGTGEAVVVLGFGNRARRANVVNRWRVRAGLRSRDPHDGGSVLVLCGGAVRSEVPEAELMARHLRSLRPDLAPVLETASHSTWENVRNAIPLVEHADRIKIVSHAFHAAKARVYLRRLRPDLADRLVPADENRVGEWMLAKPFLAVIGRRMPELR
jgi:uncharacterized SAM-binding protein YcdF (DUF218 family)